MDTSSKPSSLVSADKYLLVHVRQGFSIDHENTKSTWEWARTMGAEFEKDGVLVIASDTDSY